MPGRITKRNFGAKYHFPKADSSRIKPKTTVSPGDAVGVKSADNGYDRYRSDRQEGQKTGQ